MAHPKPERAPDGRGWRVPPNAGRTLPAEALTRAEVHALLRACSRRAPTGLRNRALLVVLYRAGLRIGEALALEPRDLDSDHGTVRVRRGKGAKPRTVAMDPEAWAVLERWLDVRAKRGLNGRHRTFCTLRGRPIDASYVRHALRRLARRAGLERRVAPHMLRHTFAAELAREGVPVHIIRRLLGHRRLETTAQYIDHLAPLELVAAVRSRPAWNGG
jgi:site-specific recombinase XerD